MDYFSQKATGSWCGGGGCGDGGGGGGGDADDDGGAGDDGGGGNPCLASESLRACRATRPEATLAFRSASSNLEAMRTSRTSWRELETGEAFL